MSISQHSLRACTLKYNDRDVCRSSGILQFYFRCESEGGTWGLEKAERISRRWFEMKNLCLCVCPQSALLAKQPLTHANSRGEC